MSSSDLSGSGSDLVENIALENVVRIEEPFKGELPAAKRPKQQYSPEIHIDDISMQDPFVPSAESTATSDTGSRNTSGSTGEEVCSDSSSFNDAEDVPIEEPFYIEDYNCFSYINSYESDLLYESSTISVLETLAILFSWFCSYPGISKDAFGRLLFLLHSCLLPKGNKLPESYGKAKTVIQHLIVPVEEHDCCINDCIVYRNCDAGNFESLDRCPECKSDRYFPYTTIARKRFKYIPLGPRIKRMFANTTASKLLQSHLEQSAHSQKISDLHQSETWISRYAKDGPFQGDPRGISLSLCTDGTNPFSKEKVSYSMWPITLSILNLPPQIRTLPRSLLLAGIIPGKSEPRNLDPYIEILVDELLNLQGCKCFDAYQKEYFNMNIDILMNVLDYPGQNKLFHSVGAGAYAGCSYCTHLGQYSAILQKMVYPGNRRFLNEGDHLRDDLENFPCKGRDLNQPPEIKTMKYVDCANKKYAELCTAQERVKLVQETGCKGAYALRKLPLHNRLLSTPVDPMHLIKNIVVHCINLIVGTEDSGKVREAERSCNRFPMSWIRESQKDLPPAPFRLSKEDIRLADDRAKKVLVPYGFDWRPREIFSKPTGYKSHEWKQICCHGVLKFCLRGMLGKNQRGTLYRLFDVLKSICAEDVNADSINNIDAEVPKVLALFERDFPLSMQVIVFHLLHHLPIFLRRFGPVYSFWMYPYERFNSWLSRRILNRRYPEATVIETYRLAEWANFMELSCQLSQGIISDEIDGDTHLTDNLPSGKNISLTDELLELLCHHYISEIPDYNELIKMYDKEKELARTAHRLKTFPEISKWVPKNYSSLSSQQVEMCRGPSNDGVQLKCFTYEDDHGRAVLLGSSEYDREHSYCRCSYVSTYNADGSLQVGRIVMLFQHIFLSATTTLAYVSWFEGPYLDGETKLSFVIGTGQTQTIVAVSSLSRPLVTALDDEELDKIWILDL